MLMRSGLPVGVLDQMICMTQAGGKLPIEKTRFFLEKAAEHGIRFFTMYGQTEATPRITYVPPSWAMSKLGSAGKPIPGGTIAIKKASNADTFGEVIYSGPNVCLGYASSAEDLSLPDQFGGVLRTGDLGYLDKDGFLFLTGRVSRDIKVSGKRVNLDNLEQGLSVLTGESVVLGIDEKIVIVAAHIDQSSIWDYVREQTTLHPSKISIVTVQELPEFPRGKWTTSSYGACTLGNDQGFRRFQTVRLASPCSMSRIR
jgi:acyl-coenzyme A synthetase/AMP-(fatty) acid ligase